MSTEATIDRAEIRRRLKSVTVDEFTKAHTRADLNAFAETMEVDEEALAGASNKGEVVQLIIANADLPDPSLRGKSTIENPVAFVFQWCDENREALSSGEIRRKDAHATLEELGVAHYTARTQYQCWYSLTNRGERALSEIPVEELPRKMQPETEDSGEE